MTEKDCHLLALLGGVDPKERQSQLRTSTAATGQSERCKAGGTLTCFAALISCSAPLFLTALDPIEEVYRITWHCAHNKDAFAAQRIIFRMFQRLAY